MKKNKWHGKTSRAVTAFTLLFVAAIVLSATAQAQDRYPNNDPTRRARNLDQYGNYGGSQELRQTALNAGYNQGVRQVNYDHQNGGKQSNYRNSDVYRRATQDYNTRLGDRELYRRYFREAFEKGYNAYANNNQGNPGSDNRYQYPDRDSNGNRARRGRNWDGYGNFGGSAELRQTALNAGYNEGNKQGQKDKARSNESYQNQTAYQKATKDYSSRLGDRGVYQRYFREAYENGYSDGVSGY